MTGSGRRPTGRTAALLAAVVIGGGYLVTRRRGGRAAPAQALPTPRTKQARRADRIAGARRAAAAEQAKQARRDELDRRAATPFHGIGETLSRWEITLFLLTMLVPVVLVAELHAPLWGAVESAYCSTAGCAVVPLVLVGWLLAVPLFSCVLFTAMKVFSRPVGKWTGLAAMAIGSGMFGLFMTPVETDSAETLAVGAGLWVLPLVYFFCGFLLLPVYGLAALTIRHGESPEEIAERRAVVFAGYQVLLLLITVALVVLL
jgi:hypothetical protein